MNTDQIPPQIEHYKFIKNIGKGGMAQVCEYHDSKLNRSVAVKLILSKFSHDSESISRFKREVKTIAALEHNAIVPIYDSGDHNGQPYFIMRCMTGGSLASYARHNTLTLENIAALLNHISSGLDYAHGKGIIHRDLKPGNILYDEHQSAYIADFGIAKTTDATSTQLTQSGIPIGTAEYMSPEQAKGNFVDQRSDIYALGIILFELLTGDVPYKSESFTGTLMKQITEPVPKLKVYKKGLPITLQKVIDKAMAKDPTMRYNSAGDMAKEYAQAILGKSTAQAQASNLLRNFVPTLFNSRTVSVVGGIAFVLGLGILLASFMWFLNEFSALSKPPSLEATKIEPIKTPTGMTTLSTPAPLGGIVPTIVPLPTSTLFVETRRETPTQQPTITLLLPTSTSIPTSASTPTQIATKTPQPTQTSSPIPSLPTATIATITPQPTQDRSGWFFSPHPSAPILSLRRERLIFNSYQNGFAVWFSNSNTTYVLANGKAVMSSVGYIDNVVGANLLGNKLNTNDYVGCAGHSVVGATTTGYISTPNQLVLSWAVQNGAFTGWQYENNVRYLGC